MNEASNTAGGPGQHRPRLAELHHRLPQRLGLRDAPALEQPKTRMPRGSTLRRRRASRKRPRRHLSRRNFRSATRSRSTSTKVTGDVRWSWPENGASAIRSAQHRSAAAIERYVFHRCSLFARALRDKLAATGVGFRLRTDVDNVVLAWWPTVSCVFSEPEQLGAQGC